MSLVTSGSVLHLKCCCQQWFCWLLCRGLFALLLLLWLAAVLPCLGSRVLSASGFLVATFWCIVIVWPGRWGFWPSSFGYVSFSFRFEGSLPIGNCVQAQVAKLELHYVK